MTCKAKTVLVQTFARTAGELQKYDRVRNKTNRVHNEQNPAAANR